MQFNAIAMPCNAMQFHAIPCNSMQFLSSYIRCHSKRFESRMPTAYYVDVKCLSSFSTSIGSFTIIGELKNETTRKELNKQQSKQCQLLYADIRSTIRWPGSSHWLFIYYGVNGFDGLHVLYSIVVDVECHAELMKRPIGLESLVFRFSKPPSQRAFGSQSPDNIEFHQFPDYIIRLYKIAS